MLYEIGIRLYGAALRLAALKNRKARLMTQGRRLTLSKIRQAVKPSDSYIWIHAASLGEFEQGRPLIERIRSLHPDFKIALSFYSPSGYEVRKDYPGADLVVYLPLDTRQNAAKFIDALNPQMAIFIKYEFWRNFLSQLRRRSIPTYLVSAIFRPNQLFFRPWGRPYAAVLKNFTHIFLQDKPSQKLLQSIGIEHTSVAGDTRFDRVTDIMRTTADIPLLDRFTHGKTRLTAIFGSSWPADENIYFPWLKRQGRQIKAIIAPHEFTPTRLAKMKELLSPEVRTVLYSEAQQKPEILDSADCLIIDCFGLLSSAYRYAEIAYIGGGFGTGIHNINEAAVYGIPVIFGPNHSKFLEAREIIAAGGGFSVSGITDFDPLITRLVTNTKARQTAGSYAGAYIQSRLGASDRIIPHIFPS